ncbi:MAG: hypothetical protein HY075_09720 [Deltaproteobacteria bacterium]|nr:hypothetical protein [Deltaproteobacteria bacterium]
MTSLVLLLVAASAQAQVTVDFGSGVSAVKVAPKPELPRANAPSGSTGITQAAEGSEEARIIMQLVRTLVPPKKELAKFDPKAFCIAKCPIPRTKWVQFIFGVPFTQSFKFDECCDIEGTTTISQKPFPVDLKLKNLGEYARVTMTVTVTVAIDMAKQSGDVSWSAAEGKLFTKSGEASEFTADYALAINAHGDVTENRGGHIHLSRIKGKSTSIDGDLLIQ